MPALTGLGATRRIILADTTARSVLRRTRSKRVLATNSAITIPRTYQTFWCTGERDGPSSWASTASISSRVLIEQCVGPELMRRLGAQPGQRGIRLLAFSEASICRRRAPAFPRRSLNRTSRLRSSSFVPSVSEFVKDRKQHHGGVFGQQTTDPETEPTRQPPVCTCRINTLDNSNHDRGEDRPTNVPLNSSTARTLGF